MIFFIKRINKDITNQKYKCKALDEIFLFVSNSIRTDMYVILPDKEMYINYLYHYGNIKLAQEELLFDYLEDSSETMGYNPKKKLIKLFNNYIFY